MRKSKEALIACASLAAGIITAGYMSELDEKDEE